MTDIPPLQSSMPDIDLAPGTKIVFEAISATDGSTVTGVKVSAIGIWADDFLTGGDVGTFGPFAFVPGPGA